MFLTILSILRAFHIGWGFSIVSCPMHSYYIVVAYLPWKSYFLWSTLQTKKTWIVCALYHYLCPGVKLVSWSFSDNFICTQHDRYLPTSAYVKNEMDISSETFFEFTEKEEIYMQALWDSTAICPLIQNLQFFDSWNFYCLT